MGKVANKGKSSNRKKKVWDQYDYERYMINHSMN